MKEKRVKRRIGIEGHDFQDFLERLNRLSEEKHDASVDIWSKEPPFRAVIEYYEVELEPEQKRDEFELAGMMFHCKDCPHMDRSNYRKNKKIYPCPYAQRGVTMTTMQACDFFYQEVELGRIEPWEGENDDD